MRTTVAKSILPPGYAHKASKPPRHLVAKQLEFIVFAYGRGETRASDKLSPEAASALMKKIGTPSSAAWTPKQMKVMVQTLRHNPPPPPAATAAPVAATAQAHPLQHADDALSDEDSDDDSVQSEYLLEGNRYTVPICDDEGGNTGNNNEHNVNDSNNYNNDDDEQSIDSDASDNN